MHGVKYVLLVQKNKAVRRPRSMAQVFRTNYHNTAHPPGLQHHLSATDNNGDLELPVKGHIPGKHVYPRIFQHLASRPLHSNDMRPTDPTSAQKALVGQHVTSCDRTDSLRPIRRSELWHFDIIVIG